MLMLFMAISILFIIYEILLHNFYKKDLENEKLIAYFSNARMQLMKMLYMKEISCNSNYFNFMIRATSYSIRTMYYKKEKLSLEQLKTLENMLDFLGKDKLKNEFKELNGEQKELFAKTVIKILELYFNTKFMTKIIWILYILKISCNFSKQALKLVKLVLSPNIDKNEDIVYLRDIDKSYSLSQYALA